MSVGRSLYRLYDPDPKRGCHRVHSWDEAFRWSEEKWGIFWTIQEFEGERVKANLKKILSWAVDLDGGDKPAMIAKISRFLKPSATIETKNGYHVYYDAAEASLEGYSSVLSDRLVPLLGGDPKARDTARILRVPGFNHWKDPNDPFAVRLVQYSYNRYTEAEMIRAFPLSKEKEKEATVKLEMRRELKFQQDDELWERIYKLDCEQALIRVSGRACVNHELFSFSRTGSGNKNILVNGKSTSCWVDKNGRIGSTDKGGPTIWQWVNWYQRDHKRTYEALKEHMPEVFK